MSLGAVMIVRDEAASLERFLGSVLPHVDELVAIDTGSSDDTPDQLRSAGAVVIHEPWVDFATARNAALRHGLGDWLLMLDADMTIEAHPSLRDWLAGDPDPWVDAWRLEVKEADLGYKLPLLTRADADVWYRGATHEALVGDIRKQRVLESVTVTHHTDGANRATKHERDLQLLEPGVAAGEPRATYYSAQALKCLGRTREAIVMYARRAAMTGTWEEERWHAQYMAARLRESVAELLAAHKARPHRPEPLEHAARLVRAQGARDDVLFLESSAIPDRMRP